MSVPPVLQPAPKQSDPLLRKVLIAAAVVCAIVLIAGFYVGFRIFTAMLQSVEREVGRKQTVRRELDNGWKEVHLPDLAWTLELPAVARKHGPDPGANEEADATAYHYYTFWDWDGDYNGTIESTTYNEDFIWEAKDLMESDEEQFAEDDTISQWKASFVEMKTGGRSAFVMTYRYVEEGDPSVTQIVYWQHVRQLHSIALSYYQKDEKEGKAAFERIWKSLKPPVLPTRSPSG